jgi:hypothetical protein
LQFKVSPGKEFARSYLEKNPSQKRAGRVAQGAGPEFKPQYWEKKKEKKKKERKEDADNLLNLPLLLT